MLLILLNRAIPLMHSLTGFSIDCVVKAPLSCQITIICGAHCLILIPALSALMWNWAFGFCIVLSSAMTYFGDQKGSDYIVGYQLCSPIEWWICNASYFKHTSGVFNIVSWVIQCHSRGEECLLQVLLAISKISRQQEYTYALGGIFSIQRHHVGCNKARQQFL